jgi:hypothetical protein
MSENASIGAYSSAFGYNNIAKANAQFVIGQFNEPYDENTRYPFLVGNGTDNEHRSNALTLDIHGNLWVAGAIHGAEGATNIIYVNLTPDTYTYVQTQNGKPIITQDGEQIKIGDTLSTAYQADLDFALIKSHALEENTIVIGRVYNINGQLENMCIFSGNTFITAFYENTLTYAAYVCVSDEDDLWVLQAVQAGGQADWNQTDSTQSDYIKNKPDLSEETSDIDFNNF